MVSSIIRLRIASSLSTSSRVRFFSCTAAYYASNSQPQPDSPPPQTDKVSSALHATAESDPNNLFAPVRVPQDPNGILHSDHPAARLLSNSSIVIQRKLEMMNVLLGFEQANRYVMMDAEGETIGYLAERDHGMGSAMARQLFSTHRSFTTHVFDLEEREVLRFHRPFSWISSRIKVYDAIEPSGQSVYPEQGTKRFGSIGVGVGSGDPPYSSSSSLRQVSKTELVAAEQANTQILAADTSSMRVIGEAQQYWAPLRRKYNLFLHRNLSEEYADPGKAQERAGDLPLSDATALEKAEPGNPNPGFAQFAYIDERWLSWDFSLLSANNQLIGSVNRNFSGFAREIFTDTGVYALRMDAASLSQEPEHLISDSGARAQASHRGTHSLGMTLDQRAVMLATAVSIDFDYFSRHSGAGGGMGFMPLWFPWGGGAAEAGAAGGAAAGGAAEAGAAGVGAGVIEAGGAGSAARAAQEAARGVGVGEGAVAGAGSLAGYEAMQRARSGQQVDDASPQAPPGDMDNVPDDAPPPDQQGDDFWGGFPPSGGAGGKNGGGEGASGGSGGDGGEGGGFDFSDWF